MDAKAQRAVLYKHELAQAKKVRDDRAAELRSMNAHPSSSGGGSGGAAGGPASSSEMLPPFALAPTPAVRNRVKMAGRPSTAAGFEAPATTCFGLEQQKPKQLNWRQELKDASRRKHAESRDTKAPLVSGKVGKVRTRRARAKKKGTAELLPAVTSPASSQAASVGLKGFQREKVKGVRKQHKLANRTV